MEYYSAVKKNETVPLAATWGDLESVTVSEGSAEHKCHISYVRSLRQRVQMNLFTKQRETHRHTKRASGHQRGKPGGTHEECGMTRYTTPYVKSIKQQGLTARRRELYAKCGGVIMEKNLDKNGRVSL